MHWRCVPLGTALSLILASNAAGQGNPTGTIRGQVVDATALPIAGVVITVSSPARPGKQTIQASENGDFIIPFLPPGDYSVTFERAGFQARTEIIGVSMAEARALTITLAIVGLSDMVNVAGARSNEISKVLTVGETYKAATLEKLPVGRTLAEAVSLAPGVTPNGLPNNNAVISGALSYENLYLSNGATLNGPIVGLPLPLYVEDAIQETSVARGSISAEYGRFGGGVVHMITKSGGNDFSGSLRASLANDAWRARTPHPGDQTIDNLTSTLELTAGGPFRKDAIWFFAAARFADPQRNVTLPHTNINYIEQTVDNRGEGKLTITPNAHHTIKASLSKRELRIENDAFGRVMDVASLYDLTTNFDLSVISYAGVLRDRVFLEGQFARKRETTSGRGARQTDRLNGTPIADRQLQARFNSPSFCSVCPGSLEHFDNWDWFGKVSYFLSTRSSGSHNVVAGVETFKEMRKNNNWQSGSSYAVDATTTVIDGATIYPVFRSDNSTYINYLPLVEDSIGNDIRTYSAFVNDAWRYNRHLLLNLGYRYDQSRAKDQTGVAVVKDTEFSPRLGLSWDIRGDGRWTAHAGFARYVAAVNTLLVDAASPGGRTASYSYYYQGPPINTEPPYVTADRALSDLFDWFSANGGINRPTRNPPVIPGKTRKIGGDMKAPNSHEYSVGVARDIGSRGVWRIDYLARNYHDMYGEFVNSTTGRVVDPTGEYDLSIIANDPDAKRTYRGLSSSVSFRLPSAQFGANYTLSRSRGNVDGEGETTASFRTTIGTYPEYRQSRWNSPMGYNANDQRHKVRAWVIYMLPVPEPGGRFDVSLLQRFDSALPYQAVGPVDSRTWVKDAPNYVLPPSAVNYYFSGRNSLRWESAVNTDVALNWSKRVPGSQAEILFRGVITNIFNNSSVISGNSVVLTAASRSDLKSFSPFTETPVLGVHWAHGPSFGQPTSPGSYQLPRSFSGSVGVRF